jgi:hypothetical protein
MAGSTGSKFEHIAEEYMFLLFEHIAEEYMFLRAR